MLSVKDYPHIEGCNCINCNIKRENDVEIRGNGYRTKWCTMVLVGVSQSDTGMWFAKVKVVNHYDNTTWYNTWTLDLWNKQVTKYAN